MLPYNKPIQIIFLLSLPCVSLLSSATISVNRKHNRWSGCQIHFIFFTSYFCSNWPIWNNPVWHYKPKLECTTWIQKFDLVFWVISRHMVDLYKTYKLLKPKIELVLWSLLLFNILFRILLFFAAGVERDQADLWIWPRALREREGWRNH